MAAPWLLQVIQSQVRVAGPREPEIAVADNLYRILSFLEFFTRHTTRPPRVVALPYMALCGNHPELDRAGVRAVVRATDSAVAALKEASQRLGIYLLTSRPLNEAGRLQADDLVLGPTGPLRRDRRGDFLIDDVRVGIYLADAIVTTRYWTGVTSDVVVLPANEGYTADQHSLDRLRASRASEAGVYLAFANTGMTIVAGADGRPRRRFTSRGKSTIHGPNGRLLAAVDGPGEAVISAIIDPEATDR
jgi:predicted amidohydrolase